MTFLVGGANSVSGYNIENSIRFNSGDDAKLQITTGSNSNRQKFTFSGWFKVAQDTGADQSIFSCADGGHQPHIKIDATSEQINVRVSDSEGWNVKTSQSFRDYSAWYHLVVAMDTTQGTAANRLKIYVNGSQVTSLSTTDYPDEDANTAWNSNTELCLGRDVTTDNQPFDGYIAEVFWIDGTQYAASAFGETDDNGIWIPKDCKADLTFGTHGFYFEFKETGTSQNSSGIGADTSGNGNHYAVTNLAATDQCTDTPTNNFATMNSLDISSPNGAEALPTFSEGNCKLTRGNEASARSTIGLPESGKWYFEVKYLDGLTDGYPQIYLTVNNTGDGQGVGFHTPSGSNYRGKNGAAGTVNNAFDGSPADDDILGFYANMDDKILIVHQNGSDFMGSGAASGIDFSSTTFATYTSGFFFVAYNSNAGSSHSEEFNFGNPPFAISSGNSDARGYGNFEFDPTLGGVEYYAICTKNLAVS